MARQARALDVLLAEVNTHAPGRSKLSDGGLGDPAHAARVSDHNPNARGVWRARDFTNDPGNGFDAADFAERVKAMLGDHPALGSGAYVIWNRRIVSTGRLTEGWRPYSGANPHDKHVHVSVATDASGYDSTAPWGVYDNDEEGDGDVWDKMLGYWFPGYDGPKRQMKAGQQLNQTRGFVQRIFEIVGDLEPRTASLESEVKGLHEKLDRLLAQEGK